MVAPFAFQRGSEKDSMMLAIMYLEDERERLDMIQEVRSKFNPDDVMKDFCAVLKTRRKLN